MERRLRMQTDETATPPVGRHRWEGCTSRRFRPAVDSVASDRPRAEQTWPTYRGLHVPLRLEPVSGKDQEWPGRPRPAVPCYQRRLDRHTDGMVRSLRMPGEQRTVTGRRRGMITHRRPMAVMQGAQPIGRGTEEHYEALYGSDRSPVYRRMRVGGDWTFGVGQMVTSALSGFAAPSPRRAMIATIAVIILVVSTVGSGLA